MYSTCRAISSPFTNRDNSIYSLLKAGNIETVSSTDGLLGSKRTGLVAV